MLSVFLFIQNNFEIVLEVIVIISISKWVRFLSCLVIKVFDGSFIRRVLVFSLSAFFSHPFYFVEFSVIFTHTYISFLALFI